MHGEGFCEGLDASCEEHVLEEQGASRGVERGLLAHVAANETGERRAEWCGEPVHIAQVVELTGEGEGEPHGRCEHGEAPEALVFFRTHEPGCVDAVPACEGGPFDGPDGAGDGRADEAVRGCECVVEAARAHRGEHGVKHR